MFDEASDVLRQYRPCNIRRKNRKKLWAVIITLICLTFLLENMIWMLPISPDKQLPPHTGQLSEYDASSYHDTNRHMDKRISNRQDPHKVVRQEKASLRLQQHRNLKNKRRDVGRATLKSTRDSSEKASLPSWIVILSRTGCDVRHFTSVPGWKVVVIGKTPRGCQPPSCVYLDAAKEKSLRYEVIKLIPHNSDSRKMIGYLYAISKGAKVIYDVDCDVIPKFNKIEFTFTGNTSGLAFTGGPVFNPYSHFGYPMLYPRGIPETWGNLKGEGRYRIVDAEVPVIQQGQVNFILGKKDVPHLKLTKDVNITFDRSSPPVYLSGHRFGPINSMNTLFQYKAFWGLFLPTKSTVDGDIIRGYVAQRLLRETGGGVGFLPPTAYCLTPPGGKSRFVASEQTTDKTITKLITTLKNWKCVTKISFFGCAKSLVSYLSAMGLITKKDSKIFDTWVSDLKRVGYREPARRSQIDITTQLTHWNPQVIYASPKVIPSEILLQTNLAQPNITKQVFEKLHKICPESHQKLSNWINPPITDIMLVVIFNYEFLFKNLPFLEFTHRMYFRHILYCGPSFKGFAKILKDTNMHHLTYVNGVDKDTWFFIYQCIVHAANMKTNVKGYLYIGDDVLLNTWNILDLPRDKFWMPMPMTYIERNQTKHPWWYYWNKSVGRTAANKVLEEVQHLAKKNLRDTTFSNFITTYDKNVKLSRVVHRSIDVFYAPAIYNEEIVKLGRIFRNHSTLLGLAVPMLHAGLVDLQDVIPLKGKSLWKDGRSKNIDSFKKDNHYLHPFKAGKDLQGKTGRDFFCGTYLTLATGKLNESKAHIRLRRSGKHHGNR